MKIGVISDTHNFFDPQIPELFKGVEHIIHAGDVGTTAIISELETIAPVTAVTGLPTVQQGGSTNNVQALTPTPLRITVLCVDPCGHPSCLLLYQRMSRDPPLKPTTAFGHAPMMRRESRI